MEARERVVALTGDEAIAFAMKQINPEVVAAYPITPQTEIVQNFSEYVADGEVDTEFVAVESEHSAMSACVGAAAAGARAMTATSSQGLAYMWEILFIASSMRLPVVMAVANRALNQPLNIHCDHSDSMGARDTGWIQLYSENVQEAYDNMIQAFKIGEDENLRLPVMVCLDGFILTHGVERVEVLTDEQVKNFIGELTPVYSLLDVENPVTYGPVDLYDWSFEHKRQLEEAFKPSIPVILEVGKEFEKLTKRGYGLFDELYMDDAEISIIVLGSTAGTAREVVKKLRGEGIKAGLIKLRVFRPFPHYEIAEAVSKVKVVTVMDRAFSFGGFGGPVGMEVRSALLELEPPPKIINYIYGIGGRDVSPEDIKKVYEEMIEVLKTGELKEKIRYLGVRE